MNYFRINDTVSLTIIIMTHIFQKTVNTNDLRSNKEFLGSKKVYITTPSRYL